MECFWLEHSYRLLATTGKGVAIFAVTFLQHSVDQRTQVS
jgi:hypothetical protein